MYIYTKKLIIFNHHIFLIYHIFSILGLFVPHEMRHRLNNMSVNSLLYYFGLLLNSNLLLRMKYNRTFANAMKRCSTLIASVFRKVLSHGQSRASAKPGVRPKP